MAQAELSTDVETFLRRAVPHMMAGKSVEEAMRAVLADDARIVTAAFKRQTSHHFPTPDERGISRSTGEQVGDCIASELSREVYTALRQPVLEAA